MKKAYFKYIIALLLFGSNGIVASHISLTSYEIVFLRTLIGSILLIALSSLTKVHFTFWLHKRQFLFLAISGMATGTSWIFLYEAYQQSGVSIASLAYYCGPVIVMALSPLLFHERLTPLKVISFLAVLCGIFLVNTHAFQEGKTRWWGLFCGGMSAVMYAFMVIFNKKAKSITGLENSTLQLSISFLTVAAFVGLKQGFIFPVASADWAPILTLGLLNTGIGCYFYFSSIGYLPAQTVAICGYLEPLLAVIFSVLILQETMQVIQIIGAGLIIGGAIFSECAEQKLRHKLTRNLIK
jgi:drug/metabolite transporter (DMT)-like permease